MPNGNTKFIEIIFSCAQVKGDDVIREAAIARLSEIVSRPLKTIIHSICDDVFFLSAYTR